MDHRPFAGVNYYRLSQTDFNGSVEYLGIKAVSVGTTGQVLSISPNPVEGGTLAFTMDSPTGFEGILAVLDTDGRIVFSTALSIEKGIQHLQQPFSELPSGIYMLHLYNGQQQWATRFLKK